MKINDKLTEDCVNTIRSLSMDAVEAAQSGHPGMPMGMADVAYVLWEKFLNHNPGNPQWFNRDRFILSAGHGSMLLYSLLHLTGYKLSLEEIKNFRQFGSLTPGHPEVGHTPGVEATTGPLGQGFATGVGMAMAEAFLAAKFNKDGFNLIDHYTYAIVSDGDLMEGISHEAASLAGHLKLKKLIYLYDSNSISIDGSTELSFTDNSVDRFKAYGWHVQVVNGHDHDEIENAIKKAKESDKPSLIECKSVIGFGSPNKEGTSDSHGAPLGADEIKLTKKRLGLDPDKSFHVPEPVALEMGKAVEKGSKLEEKWGDLFKKYEKLYANEAKDFKKFINRELPESWDNILPVFDTNEKGMASRKASGDVLNSISRHIHNLLGGSADLKGSNNTELFEEEIYSRDNYTGRNVYYGVREHAMGAALNGINLHGGVIPYGGTFLVFSDYNKPAIRVAAISNIPSIYVFTHDSIGLGEDGPTHQPIEHLASLRNTPNVYVFRPADANETAICWEMAIKRNNGPSAMILTRQSLPTLDRSKFGSVSGVKQGAYVLHEEKNNEIDLIFIATGSEVHLVLEAATVLEKEGYSVRVVSMPCVELFESQPEAYREKIFPKSVKKVISVEAGSTSGWYKWVGSEGVPMGIDRFGISAPFEKVYHELGITTDSIVKKAKTCINKEK